MSGAMLHRMAPFCYCIILLLTTPVLSVPAPRHTYTPTHPPCGWQEKLLLDAMFEIPGSDIISVHVTEEMVRGAGEAILERAAPPEDDDEVAQARVEVK